MVFGFGKKKSVEHPTKQTPQEHEISINQISSSLKEFERPRISKIIDEVRLIKSEIESNQKAINSIILQLESDSLKLDEVDKNLKIVAKRGKDAVIATIKKETMYKITKVESYEDVITLNNEVNQILKRIGDVLGLHTRVLHVFARKYADRLKEEISKLAQKRNTLHRVINEQESFRANMASIENMAENFKKLRSDEHHKRQRLIEVADEINQTRETITRLQGDISSLKSMAGYNEFLDIKSKINSLSHEKNEIKNKINSQFTKISRPLNRYSYVSSFEKPTKRLMEEMITDPYEILSTHNKASISEILQAVVKSVLSGNISVKDSDKSIEMVEETINRLDEFIVLKESHTKKLAELESKLAVFDAKGLVEKESAMEKKTKLLSELDVMQEKLGSEIQEITSQILKTKGEIESNLGSLYSTKVTIKE